MQVLSAPYSNRISICNLVVPAAPVPPMLSANSLAQSYLLSVSGPVLVPAPLLELAALQGLLFWTLDFLCCLFDQER